jgi:hypothetical protein
MNGNDYKKKASKALEIEEKIFRAGSQLYCSCVAYDVVSEATIHESLGATDEFLDFITLLIKASDEKHFIARDTALLRLIPKK